MSIRRSGQRGMILLLLTALPLAAGASGAAAVPGPAAGPWTVVASPDIGPGANYLDAVTSFSSSDAWAVGSFQSDVTSQFQTLAEHWDGSAWQVVSTPNVTWGYNELFGVAGSTPSDAWAVGYANRGNYGTERTLVLHWNGSAWGVVRSPNVGSKANILHAVAVAAPDDVWAVGRGNSSSLQSGRALIEHWDGTAWRVVKSPRTGGGFAELNGVAALAPDDVWAVGSARSRTLAMHFDGSSWTVVPAPGGSGNPQALAAVAGTSANDVWAVGFAGSRTLSEHWDGSAWTVVASTNGSRPSNVYAGVASLGPSDTWTVGSTFDPIMANDRTLSARADGASWSALATPNPSTEYDSLLAVHGLAAGDIWAVGTQDGHTLTLRASDG